ncbi:MAG: FAD-binding domain-containing protein, partial [Verrucomicrobiota bacterium]
GRSGVAVMDYCAHQLVATGYFHNHARMWFAAFWVHTCRLPWQLGAKFFMQHLWDGDAASNTLSWRWVAGLHTLGKTYLARQSNIERYLDSEILENHYPGIEQLADNKVEPAPVPEIDPPVRQDYQPLPESYQLGDEKWGIWLHDDDLEIGTSPLAELKPDAVAVSPAWEGFHAAGISRARETFLMTVIADGGRRAAMHWGQPTACNADQPLAHFLSSWAQEHGLKKVVCLKPFVGPTLDAYASLEAALGELGIELIALRRPFDNEILPLARAGFFGFWKKAEKKLT